MDFHAELLEEQLMYSNLKAALCAVSENEIREYFEKEIEKPILSQLKSNPTISAETLRQQSIQTEKILNILLTFRGK